MFDVVMCAALATWLPRLARGLAKIVVDHMDELGDLRFTRDCWQWG